MQKATWGPWQRGLGHQDAACPEGTRAPRARGTLAGRGCSPCPRPRTVPARPLSQRDAVLREEHKPLPTQRAASFIGFAEVLSQPKQLGRQGKQGKATRQGKARQGKARQGAQRPLSEGAWTARTSQRTRQAVETCTRDGERDCETPKEGKAKTGTPHPKERPAFGGVRVRCLCVRCVLCLLCLPLRVRPRVCPVLMLRFWIITESPET